VTTSRKRHDEIEKLLLLFFGGFENQECVDQESVIQATDWQELSLFIIIVSLRLVYSRSLTSFLRLLHCFGRRRLTVEYPKAHSHQSRDSHRLAPRSAETMVKSELRSTTKPRVLFPPLEPLLVVEQDNEDHRKLQVNNDDESLPFDIYESPCALYASNDVFSPTDVEDFGLCNTTFYGGCSQFDDLAELEAAATSNPTEPSLYYRLDVTFDYELYHRVGSNETKTLKFLEGVMLDHLAAVLGVKGCNTTIPVNSTSNRQRQLQRYHPFSQAELEHFVAITSEPLDYYDPDYGKPTFRRFWLAY
jgi:hypothetical protein